MFFVLLILLILLILIIILNFTKIYYFFNQFKKLTLKQKFLFLFKIVFLILFFISGVFFFYYLLNYFFNKKNNLINNFNFLYFNKLNNNNNNNIKKNNFIKKFKLFFEKLNNKGVIQNSKKTSKQNLVDYNNVTENFFENIKNFQIKENLKNEELNNLELKKLENKKIHLLKKINKNKSFFYFDFLINFFNKKNITSLILIEKLITEKNILSNNFIEKKKFFLENNNNIINKPKVPNYLYFNTKNYNYMSNYGNFEITNYTKKEILKAEKLYEIYLKYQKRIKMNTIHKIRGFVIYHKEAIKYYNENQFNKYNKVFNDDNKCKKIIKNNFKEITKCLNILNLEMVHQIDFIINSMVLNLKENTLKNYLISIKLNKTVNLLISKIDSLLIELNDNISPEDDFKEVQISKKLGKNDIALKFYKQAVKDSIKFHLFFIQFLLDLKDFLNLINENSIKEINDDILFELIKERFDLNQNKINLNMSSNLIQNQKLLLNQNNKMVLFVLKDNRFSLSPTKFNNEFEIFLTKKDKNCLKTSEQFENSNFENFKLLLFYFNHIKD